MKFSLLDERTRNNKGVLQAISLPKCDVENSIAEIGPAGLIPAAERLMIGIGRGDYQHIGVRETRDKDSGIAGRDDHHLVSHARPRQHVGEFSVATEGGSGTAVPDISVEVDDLDEALRRVRAADLAIEYGPADEDWDVRRFYVRDPFGRLVNILAHM